jgi:3-oxoacyl-[acyl-carrier protein] reductase
MNYFLKVVVLSSNHLKGIVHHVSKKYLIVGGSSGLGLALTKRLAAEGNKVIVLSRNINQLELNDNIEHHKIDVFDQSRNLPSFEEEHDGLAYCPGSINL